MGPGKKDVEGHDRDQGEQVAEGEEPPDRPEGEVGGPRRHEEADPAAFRIRAVGAKTAA